MVRRAIRLLLLVLFLGPVVRSVPILASVPRGRTEQSAGPPEHILHVVERGDTLAAIAARYGSTVQVLARVNGLHDPTRIYVGQRLTIPAPGTEVDLRATTSYVVQPGDSLAGIAARRATTWQSLARLNDLVSPSLVRAGQVLRVPVLETLEGSVTGLHTVGPGEILFGIALRYDVPPWRLMSANGGTNAALLYPGQMLTVPGQKASSLPTPFVSVDVQPLPAVQGGTLVIAVRTSESVTVTGRVFDRDVRFVESDGVHYGLAGVHRFGEPGLYDLVLRTTDHRGRMAEVTADVVVDAGRFGYERIKTSPSLLDPAVVAAERDRLNALRPTFTTERSWSQPLEPPCGGTVSSYFGTHRAYNEGPYTGYHGGIDFRGATGTPVYAPAGGTVLLAEHLTVRGGALVIDHGWGVLTGYWHLSKHEVEAGERVEQGDLIARIGNTGLSTGSHLHWEMWVGGVNVNPLHWLDAFYPWPNEGEGSDQGDVP